MARDTCYYDGHCGLCRRSTRILKALDWLGRLEFRDMTAVPARDLPVRWEQALEGMPMRTAAGRILVGFPAIRRALARTPLGFLPALILYLPGVSHVAAPIYRWVARNRSRSCSLPDAGCRHLSL